VNNIVSVVAPDRSLGDVDTPAIPAHIQEALSSEQNEPSAADKWETNPTDPSPALSAPSISHGGESSGTTLSALSQSLPVTVSSGNTNGPPVLDRVREPAKSPTHALDPGAASEDTSNRESTASAIVKLILREVEESSNAYPPLKSVARCLGVILDNCEVQCLFHVFNPRCL
jgi:hypothetical protein